MAHRQLEGKIFSHEGASYLVMSDNDWSGETLQVKRVDARREVVSMPLATVMTCIGKEFAPARNYSAG
tara:strand:+ start:17884 stop:18087 length:204 start_codon:yes stop_codon:yes gene_type:complete